MEQNFNIFSLLFLNQKPKGFSLGDELGLTESLGNLEGNKRRSVSNFDAQLATANNNVGVLPAEKLSVNFKLNHFLAQSI